MILQYFFVGVYFRGRVIVIFFQIGDVIFSLVFKGRNLEIFFFFWGSVFEIFFSFFVVICLEFLKENFNVFDIFFFGNLNKLCFFKKKN